MKQGSDFKAKRPTILQALRPIAQAASDHADIDRLLAVAVDSVFSLFNCDQVWLLYPCSSIATSYRICCQRSKPGLPQVQTLNRNLPVDEFTGRLFRLALASRSPVVFNVDTPLPAQFLEQEPLSSQALMAMALYPNQGEPWLLGMQRSQQNCLWSEQEETLFLSVTEFLTEILNTSTRHSNLYEVSQRLLDLLAHATDEEYLLRGGMDILQALVQPEYAVATTLNAEGQLEAFVFSGVSEEKAELITQLSGGKEFLGARLERALRIDDLNSHPDLVDFLLPDFPLKSLLMAPIINEGKIIGRIYLCDKRNHRTFTLDDEVLSMSFADAFAQTLIRFRKTLVSQGAQEALFLDHQRAQVTLESIADAVITIDSQGRIDYLNPLAEELIGTTQSQAQGKSLEKVACLLDEESRSHVIRDIAAWLAQEPVESRSCTALLQDARDQELIVQTSIAPLRDSQDRIFGAVLVLRDITPLRALASQLSYQATHDALTGLINRREFEVRLRQALDDVCQNNTHHVLCYLDLDQFKVVNDTCGHLAGDKLLRQLATLLQGRIREADCLGRLGGDEFGVLLLGCHLDQARGIAESLRILIRDFRFNWKGKTFQLGVSIGLVPLARGSGGLEEVLSAADTACYVAKDQGRDRIHTYRLDDCIVERHHGEMQWVTRIQQAFEESRFLIYYQPIRALNKEEHLCHGEVLLRMKGEDESLIPPMAFIPAAERYRLMSALDRWVISNTFIALEEHPIGQALIGINLSGQSVCDELFLKFVIEQLQRSPVNPRMICFEITETAAVANFDSAIRFIRALKEIGCRFALDDFGSGLSSFNYLKNLPVDYLKIDGSFVKDMVDDPVDYAMVEAIHKVGKVMGLKTIAEFVENEAILEKLRGIGVDYVQGLIIGGPRPFHKTPWADKE